MPTVTLTAIRSKIKTDLDLNEETFISNTELNTLINDSIRDVEAQIHSLYENYYLSSANIALVNGTSAYSYPSDIYADKIVKILYDNGSEKYVVSMIKKIEIIPEIASDEYYQYLPINTAAGGRQIKLYPASRETSSTNVTVWYIRNAKELSSDSDSCDIPTEFINYVYAKVKLEVSKKERDGNGIISFQKMVDDLKADMITTLMNRIPDDETNKIIPDTDFYWDMEN